MTQPRNVVMAARTILAVLLIALPAYGVEKPTPGRQQELARMMERLERQELQLAEQLKLLRAQEASFADYRQRMEQRLADQEQRTSELQTQVGARAKASVPREAKPAPKTLDVAAAPPAPAPQPQKPQPSPQLQPPKEGATAAQPVGRPPEPPKESRPPEIAPIFEQPGVLTPQGTLVLEPSFQYSHSSTDRIAIVGYTIIPAITIGLIDVRNVNRNTYVGSLAARYGLTNRLELEAKGSYVLRTDRTVSREATTAPGVFTDSIFNTDGEDIGDVEFGLRYQINQPKTGPYLIAGTRVRAPTGTGPFDVAIDGETNLPTELATGSGFWGVQPSLTFLYPSEPAVFFGGVNYLWNLEDDVVDRTGDVPVQSNVDPGDAVGFNFGMGIALNEQSSFSIGYDHTIIGKTKINGKTIPTATTIQVGSLLFGYAIKLTSNSTLSLSLGVGVTEESPDVQLTLKVPFSI